MIIWYLFWIKMYKNWIFNVSMQKDCTVCVLNDLKPFCVQYFLKFFVFFWCLKFCPACISLLLAHIWILHKILGRNALFLERFKKFCLKSKYPNRVGWSKSPWVFYKYKAGKWGEIAFLVYDRWCSQITQKRLAP